MTGRVRYRVVVHGFVQGVWFRQSCRRHAVDLGLSGWVRNCTDGSVEAVFVNGGMTVRSTGARAAEAGQQLAVTAASRVAAPAFSCAVPSSG